MLNSALPTVYIAKEKAKLDETVCTVLRNAEKLLILTKLMQREELKLKEFLAMEEAFVWTHDAYISLRKESKVKNLREGLELDIQLSFESCEP